MDERHVNLWSTPVNQQKGRHLEEMAKSGKDMKAMAVLAQLRCEWEEVG